jgi:hypothetical protein
MNFALFSVFLGTAITLLQLIVLSYILDVDNYVNYRAFLNIMNNAVPFLCLGFDTSSPLLRKSNSQFPFFWNLFLFYFFLFLLFILIGLFLPLNSKVQSLFFGLSASLSIAGTTIIANMKRSDGNFRSYFMSLNVLDKSIRIIIIIGFALLIKTFFNWAICVSLASFLYLTYIVLSLKNKFLINFHIFYKHLKQSLPMILAAFGPHTIMRFPFYAAFFYEKNIITAKIDFWLLIALSLLIPVLNSSKIEEAKAKCTVFPYIKGIKSARMHIALQETVILGGIFILTFCALKLGKTSEYDLISILLPLMIGMLLIGSVPNYPQLLCFSSNPKLAIFISAVLILITIFIYHLNFIFFNAPTSLVFLISTCIYFFIGFLISLHLKIKFTDFFRIKRMLFLGIITTFFFILVSYL